MSDTQKPSAATVYLNRSNFLKGQDFGPCSRSNVVTLAESSNFEFDLTSEALKLNRLALP